MSEEHEHHLVAIKREVYNRARLKLSNAASEFFAQEAVKEGEEIFEHTLAWTLAVQDFMQHCKAVISSLFQNRGNQEAMRRDLGMSQEEFDESLLKHRELQQMYRLGEGLESGKQEES